MTVPIQPGPFRHFPRGPDGLTVLPRDAQVSRGVTGPGPPVEAFQCHPYGKQVATLGPVSVGTQSKGWIGERYDAEAGLQYLNARYYDPDMALLGKTVPRTVF